MSAFHLDERLAGDTFPVADLGLCTLRLMNDSRWPWLVLVPKRPGLTEIHDMLPLDQSMLAFETSQAAAALKRVTGVLKINSGALGNIVRQVHVHVVGRSEGDPNWPGPVWGFGKPVPYAEAERENLMRSLAEALPA